MVLEELKKTFSTDILGSETRNEQRVTLYIDPAALVSKDHHRLRGGKSGNTGCGHSDRFRLAPTEMRASGGK